MGLKSHLGILQQYYYTVKSQISYGNIILPGLRQTEFSKIRQLASAVLLPHTGQHRNIPWP